MDLYTINYIKNNELIHRYLRDDSSWYKYLNRDSKYIKEIEEIAKKKYELTVEDRIKKFSNNIDKFSTFLSILNE